MVNLAQRWQARTVVEPMAINGEPGLVMRLHGHDDLFLALSVEVRQGRATAIHAVRNPDKLAALDLEGAIR
jgi:hypothetical protein